MYTRLNSFVISTHIFLAFLLNSLLKLLFNHWICSQLQYLFFRFSRKTSVIFFVLPLYMVIKNLARAEKDILKLTQLKKKKIIATCIIFMQVVHSTSDDSQMETSRSFAFRLLWWCGKGDLNWVIVVFINYRLNIPFLKCWGSNVFQISKSFKFGIMRYPGKYALVFHI